MAINVLSTFTTTDWLLEVQHVRDHYLNNATPDPNLAAFVIRDWPITEQAGLKDLAWSTYQSGYTHKNDVEFILELLEKYLKE